ncbi:hypothetical protein D6833_06655 [Candidatus Parcubacteria bacterium]|nr:MAG: hypothetical protein D6833_06655 [Candidatus Parcubacteria bacterium]
MKLNDEATTRAWVLALVAMACGVPNYFGLISVATLSWDTPLAWVVIPYSIVSGGAIGYLTGVTVKYVASMNGSKTWERETWLTLLGWYTVQTVVLVSLLLT